MAWKPENEVTDLGWDFTGTAKLVADPEAAEILKDAKGVIPEPSQATLDRFTNHVREIATDPDLVALVALGDDPDPAAVMDAVSRMPEDKLNQVTEGMLDVIIDVCSGCPSEEQIRALPPRFRNAFVGWVSGELVGPTGPTSGSGRSPAAMSANGASAT
jgi:hypothetical protein